jgi:hypothetical protein
MVVGYFNEEKKAGVDVLHSSCPCVSHENTVTAISSVQTEFAAQQTYLPCILNVACPLVKVVFAWGDESGKEACASRRYNQAVWWSCWSSPTRAHSPRFSLLPAFLEDIARPGCTVIGNQKSGT